MPTTVVTLTGSGTDADGTISGYSWFQISGTSSVITSATMASTKVTGLVQGTYKYQLKVTDNSGLTALDTVQITVNPATGTLLPAVNPGTTINGLNYSFYKSSSGWSVLPVFSNLTPAKVSTTTNFNISLTTRSTTFSFNFTGYIKVPTDGQYTFYTTSDDGSDLFIDNILVVNNDGLHGAVEKSGNIGLKAGLHYISVGYFQQGGGSTLNVSYAGPGVTKQIIPSSALYVVSKGNNVLSQNISFSSNDISS